MRSIEGRYPHFAHYTTEEKEEDKRLFYVAISRAMKRLIISGVAGKITPFIDSILQYFTLRFVLSDSNGIKVLGEIGIKQLRIIKTSQDNVQTRDYDISRMYDNSAIANQFAVKEIIIQGYYKSDPFGTIESTIKNYGGFPK